MALLQSDSIQIENSISEYKKEKFQIQKLSFRKYEDSSIRISTPAARVGHGARIYTHIAMVPEY